MLIDPFFSLDKLIKLVEVREQFLHMTSRIAYEKAEKVFTNYVIHHGCAKMITENDGSDGSTMGAVSSYLICG
jgi:hypothetical protein